jgi:hypothetical protein
METKQNSLDLALLAVGIGLIFGSFSPWISVSIISVAGTDGFFGFVTLISGSLFIFLASSKLWPNFLDKKYSSKLRLASLIGAVASLGSLTYVAVRIRQVAGEFSDIAETEPITQTTDDVFGDLTEALDEFAQTLADAFKPRLAMGWYVSAVSLVCALAIMFVNFRKTQNVEEKSHEN